MAINFGQQMNLTRLNYMNNGEAQEFVRKITRSATSKAKEKLKNRRLLGRDKVLEPNN